MVGKDAKNPADASPGDGPSERTAHGDVREILDMLPDALVVVDGDGTILYANDGAAGFLGKPQSVLVGCSFGHPVSVQDAVIDIVREGAVMHAEMRSRPVTWDGTPARAVSLRDITSRIEAEREAWERHEAELEADHAREREAAKARILNLISHELRTPLTPSLLRLDLLLDGRRGPLTEEQTQILQALRSALNDIDRTIKNVIDATELDHRRRLLRNVAIPLHHLATAVCEDATAVAAREGIHVVPVVTDEVVARCDAEAVRLALQAVVDNARRHSHKGDTIRVIVRRADGEAEVAVEDEGSGIGREELKALFRPFEQTADSARLSRPGLGLSLHIAKALLEAAGGRLTASSPGRGEGSTFRITLPLAAEDEPKDAPRTADPNTR